MKKWITRFIILFVVLGVSAAALAWYMGDSKKVEHRYRTEKVGRGDVVVTIGATGTVEPDEVIDVGSQVTGQIVKFGTDVDGKTTDYHSTVKSGALLALIDDTTYRATLNESKAQLQASQAGVARAEADKKTARAKLDQARADWERAEKIGPGDALAQTQFDTYKSTFEQAEAALSVADASIATALATVDQTQSAVDRANRNVDYCTIKSPVDGVVIDRRVNVGQTVVSVQSASSLFLIAKDLKHMQVWVAVNEADIGHIQGGQAVRFTCDSFGDRQFKGKVKKVRLNAQMTQNVVIYTVEVAVDNPDLALIPYLTANVQFETERADDTVTVPNGALRWTPTDAEQIVPGERDQYAATDQKPAGKADAAGNNGGKQRGGKKGPHGEAKPGLIWVKEGEFVRPVNVTAGVTDGIFTAVNSDELKEGDEAVTGTIAAAAGDAADGPTNPFLPKFPSSRKK